MSRAKQYVFKNFKIEFNNPAKIIGCESNNFL